jgi:hypothetical protein
MGALFGESVGGGVRYALLAVLGLIGLDTIAHALFKLSNFCQNAERSAFCGTRLHFYVFYFLQNLMKRVEVRIFVL